MQFAELFWSLSAENLNLQVSLSLSSKEASVFIDLIKSLLQISLGP